MTNRMTVAASPVQPDAHALLLDDNAVALLADADLAGRLCLTFNVCDGVEAMALAALPNGSLGQFLDMTHEAAKRSKGMADRLMSRTRTLDQVQQLLVGCTATPAISQALRLISAELGGSKPQQPGRILRV